MLQIILSFYKPCAYHMYQMWPTLIARSKEGGADVIETYTFWNGHEPTRGQVLIS